MSASFRQKMVSNILASSLKKLYLRTVCCSECLWIACWPRGIVSRAKSRSIVVLMKGVYLKSSILLQDFLVWLVGQDHFDLPTFWIPKGIKIEVASFAIKSPSRYWLRCLLARVRARVPRRRLGSEKYLKVEITGLKITAGTYFNCKKIPGILRYEHLYALKHHLDSRTFGYPMLRQVFRVHYNGALCRTVQPLVRWCLLYYGL